MAEEYKEEYPEDCDPFTKLAFEQSFMGMKSDSVDYVLEHHEEHPLSMVLFYDNRDVQEHLARFMAEQVLYIFTVKKADILRKGGPNMTQNLAKRNS
jgi:hypothetical protein